MGGPLNCLINNAGITKDNCNKDEYRRMEQSNRFKSYLNISNEQICNKKNVKNKFGKIINITSVVGHTGNVGQTNYTASKAGIVAMSKSLAIEYSKI